MISVVILNWLRPHNIKNIIIPALEQCDLVDEIIISHCKQETKFTYDSSRCRVVHRDDCENNDQHGLATRFIAAQCARNRAVLILDDDLLPSPITIAKLYNSFVEDPCRIHGTKGRKLDSNLNYNCKNVYGEVLISLTVCMMIPQELAHDFFTYEHLVKDMISSYTPMWNGEDIFMSLVSIKKYKKLPVVYKLKLKTLQQGNVAVSACPGHLQFRQKFVRYAVQKLGLQQYVQQTKLSKYDLVVWIKRLRTPFLNIINHYKHKARKNQTFLLLGQPSHE